MRLRLIVVGRDRGDAICEAADGYLARVRRDFECEVVELKEVPLKKTSSVLQVMSAEAERIRQALHGRDKVVALDRSGRTLDSEQLAERIRRYRDGAASSLAVVIGGPSGLHPDLMATADEVWSLSALTLPHRIARLLVCEQLYRACSILRGEPYHK